MSRLFKLLVTILIFAGSGVYAQCPENIGFEDGTLKNWQIYAGQQSRAASSPVIEVSQPLGSRVVIMKASSEELDPYGHFPTTSPNGSGYAVRLGDAQTGGMIDRLTYTFTVPPTGQYGLIVNYAAVLQNPSHGENEQPRFTINAYNVTDDKELDCPAFSFIASNPAFKLSDIATTTTGPGGNTDVTSIFYQDWTTTTINLIGYSGKTIRLTFNTNDCTQGGHFGYAYFDINEQCTSPITGNTYCEGQSFLTLRGPRGFNSYKWYAKNDMNTVLDTTQVLKLSPAPAAGTEYSLVIDAIAGLGCRDTLYTTIFKSPASFTFKIKQPVFYICEGGTFNLKAAYITEGSSTGLLPFEYYTDPVTEEYLRDPDKITKPGIYYIKATNAEGCSNTSPVELKYYDPPSIVVTNPAPVPYPGTIDLSSTYVKQPGYNYSFYKDAKATISVEDYQKIGTTGRYYIKAISATGCEKMVSVVISITPPDPYSILAPTVFTPNNDGINDIFNVTIKGYVDFGTLSIYNRSGQVLYKTNKQTYTWDGYIGGRPLPAGTYYWLFEGIDGYYHTKFNRSGYVSIIK